MEHPDLISPGNRSCSLAEIHRGLQIPANYAADRGLSPQAEAAASDLVVIGTSDTGQPIRLTTESATAWQSLQDSAAQMGITLVPISGFRSIARQAEIIREKLRAGHQLEAILRFVAAPGFSEHHTGRAIDFGSPEQIELDEGFAQTAAYRWLEAHAGSFGFHLSYPRGNHYGIGFEPWHWCWHSELPRPRSPSVLN
jgi:D-alanyl-D-alanine carboxypeptidase